MAMGTRGGGQSIVAVGVHRSCDPHDRFSGTGMYSQSAKQVTRFMKNSKASDEENVRWLREKEKESFRRKTEYMNQQSNPRRRGMVKGGDSIAWDDGASFAASSLASGGPSRLRQAAAIMCHPLTRHH